MSNQFWRRKKVEEETGLACSSIYELMDAGQFPKSFKIMERSVAWLSDDIQKWKAERLAAAGKKMEAA